MSKKAKQVIAEKIEKNAAVIIRVDAKNPEGGDYFAFVAIRLDRWEPFKKACATGKVEMNDYGIVIESGEGEPSDEVKERMIRDFGFRHGEEVAI